MKRKMVCLILTISMMLNLFPIWALAESTRSFSEIWDGSIASAFAGGNGSETDPFQISNGAQLAYLAELVNTKTRTGGYYILTQDIYLNDISNFNDWSSNPPVNEWTPIGFRTSNDYSYQFNGNFNGDGYTIYGAYINKENTYAMGIFGSVSQAVISNLNVIDCYFTGTNYIGGIAGTSRKETLFYNCYSKCLLQGEDILGGIVGADDRGTFQYCCNEGNITATVGGAGGIVGNSHGEAANFSTGTIQYCYNTGNITGVSGVGGITGSASYISDCYNTGIIRLDNYSGGGIAGTLSAIAETGNNYIYRCYNAGKIICTDTNRDPEDIKMGALIGNREVKTQLNNSYYLDTTAEYNIGVGGWYTASNKDALTDAQMRISENFAGFDFKSVWYIDESCEYQYPQLAFPDETRRYAIISVADITTNEQITDFTVNLDYSSGLSYIDVDGTYYIVGNGRAFDSNIEITINADGYDPFIFYSNNLKNSISLRYTPNNMLYLSPVGEDISELDELQQAYIWSHKQFYQNEYSDLVQNYGFQNALWQYDNGESFYLATMGNWIDNVASITTLSFGDIKLKTSYYEQFLIDLISIMTEVETTDPLDTSNLNAVSTVMSWIDVIEQINKDKAEMFETSEGIERWNEIWNNAQIAASNKNIKLKDLLYDEAISKLSLPDGSGEGYLDQFIRQIQGQKVFEKEPDLLNKIFKSTSITENAISHIATTADTISAFRETTSTYIMVKTYMNIYQNIFSVLEQAGANMDSKYSEKVSDFIDKYELDTKNEDELYKNYILELAGDTTPLIYETFLKDKLKDASYNGIGKLLNCPVFAVKAIATAIQIGHFFGDGLTGLSSKTENYTIIYYIAPLEAALEELVREYGEKLVNNGTYEDAQRFEYAYRTLAATNQYLYKCYWSMGANEAAFGVGDHHIGQVDKVMEYGASMQNLWKKTSCHGDTNIVNNQFKYTSIQCPVDVYVYDESNKLVVSIVNEQVVQSDPAFTVLTSNGKKSLVYPAGHDYQIKIVAREDGVMSYMISEIDGNNVRHVDCYNIPITKNQEFSGEIPSEFNVEKTAYSLKTDNEIVPADYDSNEEDRVLDTPTELEWKGTCANWKAVNNATAYTLGVYRNNQQIALIDVFNTSVDLNSYMIEDGLYSFYVIAIGDKVNYLSSQKSSNSKEFEIQTTEKSTDTTVKELKINGITGTINGDIISVVLPYGTTIPCETEAISITTAVGATYGDTLSTFDGGKTWIFTVTAQDGITQKNYTVNVTVALPPETGYQDDLDKVKSEILQYNWTIKQSVANTADKVREFIESQLNNMNLNNVNYTVSVTELIKAISGTVFDKNGTNGKFTFEIMLSKGEGENHVVETITVSGEITALYFSGSYPSGGSSSSVDNDIEYTISNLTPNNGSIFVSSKSAKNGTTITVIVIPDEGYKLSKLNVIDESGNSISLKEIEDNKYIFTMPNSQVTISADFSIPQNPEPEPPYLPFMDISADDWYAEAVKYVYDNNLMIGTSDTAFSPNQIITRGMIVTILYRLEGEPTTKASSFNDIPLGQYYTNAVAWAYENNIVLGYENGLFGPNDTITREQIASIMYRYAQYKDYDLTVSIDLSGFVDVSSISKYAVSAVQWANAEKLIIGISNTELKPQSEATRAQVASILMRFIKNIAQA